MIRGQGVPRHLPSVWMWVASAAGVRTLAAERNDKHRGETQVVNSQPAHAATNRRSRYILTYSERKPLQ
jgi:hypothetical protein